MSTTTQKAASKATGKKRSPAPDKSQIEKAAKKANVAPEAVQPEPQASAEFQPLVLPVAGPLARKENVEKLEQLANQVGVPLKIDTESGHVITEEQRKGERRQAENDRRRREQEEAAAAAEAARILAKQPEAAVPPVEGVSDEDMQQTEAEVSEEDKTRLAFEAEMKTLAEKYGMPAPSLTVASTPRSGRPQQNGITRPGTDTVTGKVWRVADEVTLKNQRAASISEVKLHPELKHVNDHTIRTQYARWRKFNGIEGRVATEPRSSESSSKGAAKMQWPSMADADFFKYDDMEREGKLVGEYEGYRDWLFAERDRRAAMREAKKNGTPAAGEPMTDEVFKKFELLEKNKSPALNDEMKAALKAERARRAAAQPE